MPVVLVDGVAISVRRSSGQVPRCSRPQVAAGSGVGDDRGGWRVGREGKGRVASGGNGWASVDEAHEMNGKRDECSGQQQKQNIRQAGPTIGQPAQRHSGEQRASAVRNAGCWFALLASRNQHFALLPHPPCRFCGAIACLCVIFDRLASAGPLGRKRCIGERGRESPSGRAHTSVTARMQWHISGILRTSADWLPSKSARESARSSALLYRQRPL